MRSGFCFLSFAELQENNAPYCKLSLRVYEVAVAIWTGNTRRPVILEWNEMER